MRNFIVAFLISALMLPAFISLAPHEAFHALYDAHILQHVDLSHHNETQSEHFYEQEDEPYVEHENIHHNIPTDLASYFKGFLHVDLKNTDQEILLSTLISDQNIDYDLALEIFTNNPYDIKYHQKLVPPVGHVFVPNFQSLYLTTIRLLI